MNSTSDMPIENFGILFVSAKLVLTLVLLLIFKKLLNFVKVEWR